MALLNYSFYENENGYAGTTVSDDLFSKYLIRAKKYLDKITFSRIQRLLIDGKEVWGIKHGNDYNSDFMEFTDTELESVRYAVCALIDCMYRVDMAEEQAIAGNEDSANIKSRSSGGESISYEVGKSAYNLAAADKKVKDTLFIGTVRDYMVPSDFRINPFYAGSR